MIQFTLEPLSAGEASRVKTWLSMAEAQMFRECIEAQMNEHYIEAVNKQAVEGDPEKFTAQANALIGKANEYNIFLRIMRHVASESYGLHRIKIQ